MQHGKDVVEQVLRTRAQAFEVTLCDGRQIGTEGRSLGYARPQFVVTEIYGSTVATTVHLIEVTDIRNHQWG